MNFSMENRSPFLNSQLFGIAYSIPEKYLMRDGMTKAPLRDAMRGIVPDDILDNRKKIGFNAPILDLLDVSDPCVVDEIMADDFIFDYVDRDKIYTLLKKDFLKNSESKFLFSFLNAKYFLQYSKHRG
jgi:asparagine synthase (glutamine-hydrolysing)